MGPRWHTLDLLSELGQALNQRVFPLRGAAVWDGSGRPRIQQSYHIDYGHYETRQIADGSKFVILKSLW